MRVEHGRGHREGDGGGHQRGERDDAQPGDKQDAGTQAGEREPLVAGAGVEDDEQAGEGGE